MKILKIVKNLKIYIAEKSFLPFYTLYSGPHTLLIVVYNGFDP